MQVIRPVRVLIVEDDDDFWHLIVQTLELENEFAITGL